MNPRLREWMGNKGKKAQATATTDMCFGDSKIDEGTLGRDAALLGAEKDLQ